MSFDTPDFGTGDTDRTGRLYLGASQMDPQYVQFTFRYGDIYNPPTPAELDQKFADFVDYIRAYPGAQANSAGHVVDTRVWTRGFNEQNYPPEETE